MRPVHFVFHTQMLVLVFQLILEEYILNMSKNVC